MEKSPVQKNVCDQLPHVILVRYGEGHQAKLLRKCWRAGELIKNLEEKPDDASDNQRFNGGRPATADAEPTVPGAITKRHLFTFSCRLDDPSSVEQTDAQRCCFQKWTHLAEVEKQRFSSQNKPEQLETHPCIVAYHSEKF